VVKLANDKHRLTHNLQLICS